MNNYVFSLLQNENSSFGEVCSLAARRPSGKQQKKRSRRSVTSSNRFSVSQELSLSHQTPLVTFWP